MVLPTGTIFVLTGLLDTMTNVPDQLGVVLAHEMAHTVIGHGVSTLDLFSCHFESHFVIVGNVLENATY